MQNILTRKYAKNLSNYGKKEHLHNFSTISINDMESKKNTNLFCWYKNTEQQPKHNSTYTISLKAFNFIKKRLQHRCFSVKFLNILKTLFLTEHLQWLPLTYDKSFLVLVIISFP